MAEPATYPVGTIAKLLMISERRVQQLTKEGIIPKSERGRYHLAEAVQGYIRYLQERSIGSVSAIDYHVEKARLVKLQADRADAELQELLCSLVSADEVSDAWAKLLVNVKAKMLAIPTKLAPQVAHLNDHAAVKVLLDEQIREILLELSDADSYGAIASGHADTEAPAVING